MKLKSLFAVVPSVLLLLAISKPLAAQNSDATAKLTGVITDSSALAVSGVKIAAHREGEAAENSISITSSTDGSYSLSLSPGLYQLTFSRESFAARTMSVTLSPAETRSLNLRLELESLSSSVVVTAQTEPVREEQTAAPTDIITRETIEARQSVGLPDLLLYSTGVTFGRTGANGGTASLFLNGGNSNFTKVLVDGTPVNPPGSAVDFSLLTTDNIDKVEIVRGAESAIYGTDAVSGVVQLFTHRGTTEVPAFSLFSEGGSYSNVRGGGQISGLFHRLDYSGAASYQTTGGQGPNDEFLNRTLSGNFGYSFTNTNQLHLALRANTTEAGIPGQTIFTPPSLHQRINQQLFAANARWDFSTGSHWHHQLMGTDSYSSQHSFNSEQSFYISGAKSFCPQASPTAVATTEFCDFTYDSRFQYNRASVGAQSSYVLKNLVATAGYQYEVENGAISYLDQPHVRRNNQGGYLDFRVTPVSRLSLDFGSRVEANGNFGTRVTPRAGASLLARRGRDWLGDTRLRAFYGQGIKESRFDQNYGTDPCDPGNASLKPEASKNWTAGIEQKLASDRIKVSADYFYNRFYDIASFSFCLGSLPCAFPSPPNCPFGHGNYFNTDLAFARGANFGVQAQATKWLFVTADYTYDDTRVLESPNSFDPALIPGNRLIRRPLHSGSVSFVATFHKFSAVFAGYFTGQRTDSDFLNLNQTRNPGYARFDLSANYSIARGFSLYARATNLFDKQYQDALGYPALGRDARIGVRYQFAGHK